jgi:hypothetical protein
VREVPDHTSEPPAAAELAGLRALIARVRDDDARLLRLLKLNPAESGPPGPTQTGIFEAHPGPVHSGSPPEAKASCVDRHDVPLPAVVLPRCLGTEWRNAIRAHGNIRHNAALQGLSSCWICGADSPVRGLVEVPLLTRPGGGRTQPRRGSGLAGMGYGLAAGVGVGRSPRPSQVAVADRVERADGVSPKL